MRIRLLIILLFSLNFAFGYNQGDILFQESKTVQTKYIKAATLIVDRATTPAGFVH